MPKAKLRRKGQRRPERFRYRAARDSDNRLTHYLFRYPAKFHPPILRELILRYSRQGGLILDPFVGSGSLLVEASTLGRHSIGIDVDPIAIEVARAKVMRFDITRLEHSSERLLEKLKRYERLPAEYKRRTHVDLSSASFRDQQRRVRTYIPRIPDIEHWFRRYVIVDLALILRSIDELDAGSKHKRFFNVVFASIIRNSSNADPVPVSGLEVTAHMRRIDEAGRVINPFALFRSALLSAVRAAGRFSALAPKGVSAEALAGSATKVYRTVGRKVDAVITSPPYQGAVDYYRRHKLEMYWLGFTKTEDQRRALLDKYIGRIAVPARLQRKSQAQQMGQLSARWAQRIARRSPSRATGFRHYIKSMSNMFEEIGRLMRPGRPAVFVVGNSNWMGYQIPTADLLREAAAKHFKMKDIFYYPIKNRYMSYTRHNGANIRKDFVLVMRRTRSQL
jgi:DNA modification methylase